MNVEYHFWDSIQLKQKMELKIFGETGRPFLIFPTSSGRFYDFADRGMINTVSKFVEEGKLQFVCVDSVDPQTWDKKWAPAPERVQRHEDYDRYIVQEVIPFIKKKNKSKEGIITSGVSMGATHAVNFYFRHPDIFGGCLALSGLYHSRGFLGEYMDETLYYNSPLSFLPNLKDETTLKQLRQGDIVVCCGRGAWEHDMLHDTQELKRILKEKKIPAMIDIWGTDVNHDWPWWEKQFPYFVEKLLNRQISKE
jgi:esterase/lipase superfamily enzyme